MNVEQRHHQETSKEVVKHDRRVKELAFQSDEDKKTQIRLQRTIEKLEAKIKSLRRQVEETEEIASANLYKYRAAQQELENAFERADIAENQVNKIKAHARSASIAPKASTPQVKIITTV